MWCAMWLLHKADDAAFCLDVIVVLNPNSLFVGGKRMDVCWGWCVICDEMTMWMAERWPVRPCRRFVNIIGDIYLSVLLCVIWHCAFFGSEVKVNIVDDDHDDDRTSCRLDFFLLLYFYNISYTIQGRQAGTNARQTNEQILFEFCPILHQKNILDFWDDEGM